MHKTAMVSLIRIAELLIGFAAVLHWTSILVVGLRARQRHALPAAPPHAPGVSIVRPVCGLENHIEETLLAGYGLSYPHYETLFCVASGGDPVVPLVRRLIAQHPNIPARLLVGDDRISINPKLNNIVKGWRAAAYDWIVMADSNVLMPPDYIERLFSRWGPETGLTSAPPAGVLPENIWAELECGFLNTYQARWQLAADAFGLGFAHGKTMLWRRDILEAAGGIEALGAEPAEDAAGTKIVRARGLKVRLVGAVPQPLGRRRFLEVWQRQLRWARLRRASFGLYFYPELFSGGFFPFCLAGFLVAAGAAGWASMLAFAVLWYGAEMLLALALRWPLSLRSPLLWILRDLMLPGLWVAAMSGRAFAWRGNAMDVRAVRRGSGGLQLAGK